MADVSEAVEVVMVDHIVRYASLTSRHDADAFRRTHCYTEAVDRERCGARTTSRAIDTLTIPSSHARACPKLTRACPRVRAPPSAGVLRRHEESLKSIFEVYAVGDGSCHKHFSKFHISVAEWLELLGDFELVGIAPAPTGVGCIE